MKRRAVISSPPPAGLEPVILCSEVGSASNLSTRTFLHYTKSGLRLNNGTSICFRNVAPDCMYHYPWSDSYDMKVATKE